MGICSSSQMMQSSMQIQCRILYLWHYVIKSTFVITSTTTLHTVTVSLSHWRRSWPVANIKLDNSTPNVPILLLDLKPIERGPSQRTHSTKHAVRFMKLYEATWRLAQIDYVRITPAWISLKINRRSRCTNHCKRFPSHLSSAEAGQCRGAGSGMATVKQFCK